MSYQALQDALHEIAARGNYTAELFYGADPSPVLTECHDCYGTDPCCPTCHGAGWWRG